jgi:ribosomal protein S18 acetylase RimI-like enzyme
VLDQQVTIRRMEEDDVPACILLWSEADREPDLKNRVRRLLAQRPRLSVVAEIEAEVCGWALVSYNGFSAHVQRIVVAMADRKTGVGQALMAGIEQRAGQAGARDVSLITEERAVGFYQRLGYAVTGSRYAFKKLSPGRPQAAAPFSLSEARTVLSSTPGTLHSMLGAVEASWLSDIPPGEEWSPMDVVGHLISGEETDWMVRVQHLLEHGAARPFEPFDREAMRSDPAPKGMPALLDRFEELRAVNLQRLGELKVESRLALTGLHPSLGDVTLGQLVAAWAAHDLGHLAQLSRILAARYRDAVGPWRSYLSILDR